MTDLIQTLDMDAIPQMQRRRNRDRVSRVADLLADELVQAGVEVVFGVPGGAIAPLYDALYDRKEIHVVVTRHENHAVFAAAGYAQTTGRLGVVLVTSGPGVLNTMNGLGSSHTDGLPVLVLAGEASRRGFARGAVQEGSSYALNLVRMASNITKISMEVTEAHAAPGTLRRAMATAVSGRRGAAFVSLPLDVLGAKIPPPTVSLDMSTTFRVPSDVLLQLERALTKPGSKVILAGAGCRWGRAPQLLSTLAERLQIPVMTTPKAKGIFSENHPLSLGVYGIGGHPSTRVYLDDGIDVVLALGTSLGEAETDGWSERLKARRSFIHVDIDVSQIGRVFPTDIGVVAPVEAVLEALVERNPPQGAKRQCGIVYDLDPQETREGTEQLISAPRALWELQGLLPHDAIYTCDSGSNLFYAAHYLRIADPDSFVALFGLASMGSSLGLALGAQLAHPTRTVVAVCGDGGFHMTSAELTTAALERLPLIVAVLNDGRFGMVEAGNMAVYGRTPLYPTTPLDIPRLAEASGAQALTIEHPDQLSREMLMERKRDRPLVLNIRIDRSVPIPANRRISNISKALQSKAANAAGSTAQVRE